MKLSPGAWLAGIMAVEILGGVAPPRQETKVQLQPGDDTIRASFCLGAATATGVITVDFSGGVRQVFRLSIEPEKNRPPPQGGR